MKQDHILNNIIKERVRQDQLHPHNTLDQMLSILIEEVGEVGAAMQQQDQDNLKEELVHVAAVCVRWLEML